MAYILKTKKANISGAPVKGFPVLFMEDNRVHWLSLNYFLDLYGRLALSTVSLYAQHIQDLYSQIEVEEEINEVTDIDDSFLIAFKNELAKRGGMRKSSYTYHVMNSIILYCSWLENNDYCRNLIGDTKHHRIRVKYTEKGRIKHPLCKVTRSARKTAPRSGWIETIKRYGPTGSGTHMRFELMIDWSRSAGLRALETCSLKVHQLPSIESVNKALLENRCLILELLVTKGSKQSSVEISPLLLKRTWNYINTERARLLDRFKNTAAKRIKLEQAGANNDYIFLSELTATKIDSRSYSNSIRSAFLSAVENEDLTEAEHVWTHGLRHNFSVKNMRFADDNNIKHPEAVTRQKTRHGSDNALDTYLLDRANDDFS
ncbi:tyrosine-type recombinase/integrase [Pseudoalteromonas carrageenovora]|uniref:tyrosine-type recombinase/integrase n=1 Tax=Pseudoalteromonas carrageenovora TaxID=227 RepID=UPI002FD2B99A